MPQITRKIESDYTATEIVVKASENSKPVVENSSDKIQAVAARSLSFSDSPAAIDSQEISRDLNESAVGLNSKEKASKFVSFRLFAEEYRFNPIPYPIGYWYSRQEEEAFKAIYIAELQDFQNRSPSNEFENSESILRINIEKFKHRMNFSSSYLEETPSKLDVQMFRSVENVLQNRSTEIPLRVRESIEEYLKKEIPR